MYEGKKIKDYQLPPVLAKGTVNRNYSQKNVMEGL